ncbi:MAG: hypothetical protein A2W21_00990 [Betaproteobacteria bacterium RBG_16_66_20]|nr:MAG: hypothetical protein A2W21_00990 [Betaproteobacteria bacterium RBG_16_66_20]
MISEATVIAVAAALHLVDCMVLLGRGQALLEAPWPPIFPRMALAFGSTHYQIGGRAVALLNPFTPFIPVFRTLPLFSGPGASNARISKAARAVAPASAPVLLQFLLIFVVLPYCLYRAPGWPFVVSLALAYLNAIAMLGLIWWRLRGAGIATRPLIGLGFAWLVCLPLSVNCLRKAGLAFNIAMDAPQAIRLLPAGEKPRARNDLAAQITEALDETDEGDERHRRLAELRRQLTLETGHGGT